MRRLGGALVDLTGNGRLDLIAATSDRGSCVYWWECPADPAQRWVRRDAVPLPANRTHDLGEMGRADWTVPHPLAQRLFLSRGECMEELVIDSGVGTHEAQAIELVELDGPVAGSSALMYPGGHVRAVSVRNRRCSRIAASGTGGTHRSARACDLNAK